MNKSMRSKVLLVLLIGFISLLAVGGMKFMRSQKKAILDPQISRSIGNNGAPIKIIEFIDLQCPACAKGVELLKQYTDKHPQEIFVQVKFFPLVRMHQHAMRAAIYTECVARQGKFWPFLHQLMPAQAQWSPLINADNMFDDFAKSSGVNMGQLNQCLEDPTVKTVIEVDRQQGLSLGVNSTPTYFVNDKMVVGPKVLEEELKPLLEKK